MSVDDTRLTEASYIVLGLLEQTGPATPYDLKRLATLSTLNFWTVPHTQIYTECARLAEAGLLAEEREQTGRRRRVYRLTDSGRAVLGRWRADPSAREYEFRDVATLKMFFGADPAGLAVHQVEMHARRLREYEALLSELADQPPGWALALELGIGHEREFLRFWSRFLEQNGNDALSGTDPHRRHGAAPTPPGRPRR
jgi:DNA-binding PadR family transcriptional regulator